MVLHSTNKPATVETAPTQDTSADTTTNNATDTIDAFADDITVETGSVNSPTSNLSNLPPASFNVKLLFAKTKEISHDAYATKFLAFLDNATHAFSTDVRIFDNKNSIIKHVDASFTTPN